MTKKKNPNLSLREALIESWKNRADYKGYDKTKGSSYNSWRSIINTKKGKQIGFPPRWRDYNKFMEDVQGDWERGYVAIRIDTTKPHSKENTFWAPKGSESTSKLIQLEYNGETKTLLEWSRDLKINYNGLRLRYFRHKDWASKEILFGKPIRPRAHKENDYRHRIIRMCGAYKLRDKRKGLSNDIDSEWLIGFCQQPCFYCGDTRRVGVDRIDNSLGHTKDNVVPCCCDCNCARMNNFTHEEMKILGKTIKEIKWQRLHKKTS